MKGTYYRVDGSVGEVYEYEYDRNGNLLKETWYRDDGGYNIYEYDEAGNLIIDASYSADGYYCISEHYDDWFVSKTTWYNADGSISEVYEYDRSGNLVKYTDYNADGTINFYEIIEQDGNGNYVRTRYGADGTMMQTDFV